jgi:hypothetical protein
MLNRLVKGPFKVLYAAVESDRERDHERIRLIKWNLNEVVHSDHDCERGWNFVRAKSRPDCLQSEFLEKLSRGIFLSRQSEL